MKRFWGIIDSGNVHTIFLVMFNVTKLDIYKKLKLSAGCIFHNKNELMHKNLLL